MPGDSKPPQPGRLESIANGITVRRKQKLSVDFFEGRATKKPAVGLQKRKDSQKQGSIKENQRSGTNQHWNANLSRPKGSPPARDTIMEPLLDERSSSLFHQAASFSHAPQESMAISRYRREDGKIAVLSSTNWKYPWATDCGSPQGQEVALFDRGIVEAVLDGNTALAATLAGAKIAQVDGRHPLVTGQWDIINAAYCLKVHWMEPEMDKSPLVLYSKARTSGHIMPRRPARVQPDLHPGNLGRRTGSSSSEERVDIFGTEEE